MPHPKRILRKTEPSKPISSPNSISKCSTASHAEFTPESSRSEETKKEEADYLLKEFKETQLERLSGTKTKNDLAQLQILYHLHIPINTTANNIQYQDQTR